MRNLFHRLQARLGRRGVVLFVFSLVFFFTGIKALTDPAEDAGRFILYTLLPPIIRAIIWIVPAIIGTYAAFSKRSDAPAYAALTIPPVLLIVSYIGSEIAFFLGVNDYGSAWVRGLQWILILALLLVTSGWKETEETALSTKEDE